MFKHVKRKIIWMKMTMKSTINLEDIWNGDFNPEILECTGEIYELYSSSSHTTAKVYTKADGEVTVKKVVHFNYA